MSTVLMHPVKYLRLPGHCILTGLRTSLGSLVKKVFDSSEQAATIAVLLSILDLIICSCLFIGQSASIAANYNAAIAEMVFPPFQAIPPGM